MTTSTQPTAEAIATLDPTVDPDAAYNAGVTYSHRAQHIKTVACPRPRCSAEVGSMCRTPNGWMTQFHRERADLAYGRTRPSRRHRLTDVQAEWLESAAHTDAHRLYAPGQYATMRGDRAMRQTADALEAAGLIRQVGTGGDGCERIFELTAEGWRVYWTHRLVIRHNLPDHPDTCPCRTTRTETVQ